MKNEVIAPINHGPLSAVSTTAVETAKSGFSGFFKGAFAGGFGALLGGPIVGGALLGGLGLIGGALFGLIPGIPIIAAALGAGAVLGTVGLVVGAVAGVAGVVPGVTYGGGLGAIFGGLNGASRGLDKVGQERGAANMLSAQVEAVKAQNAPQTVVMAQPPMRDASFPAQGSPMNQAGSTVFAAANDNAYAAEAARAQTQGTVSGAELGAARA